MAVAGRRLLLCAATAALERPRRRHLHLLESIPRGKAAQAPSRTLESTHLSMLVNVNAWARHLAQKQTVYFAVVAALSLYVPDLYRSSALLRESLTEKSLKAEQVSTVAFCMITATAPLLLELLVEAVRCPGVDDLLERCVLLGALAWTSLFIILHQHITNAADVFQTVVCGDWIIVIGCLNSLLRARARVKSDGGNAWQRTEVFPSWYGYLLTGTIVVMGVLMKIYLFHPSASIVAIQNSFAWLAVILIIGKLLHWAVVIWLSFESSVLRFDVLWENLSLDHWLSLKMWTLIFILLIANLVTLPPPTDIANLGHIDRYSPLRIIMVQVGMLVVVYAALGLPGETRARSLYLEKELDATRTIIRFVSHEMRTPLNTIVGAIQLLEDELKRNSRTSKEANDYIVEVKGASNAAVEVLDDLLLYERLESDSLQLHMEQLNPIDFLNDAFISLRSVAMEANVGIALRVENRDELSNLSLCVDERRLKLAIRNVLLQIISSSSPGKDVEVVVYLRAKRSVKGVHRKHFRRNSVVPLRTSLSDQNATIRIRIRNCTSTNQNFDDVRALSTVPKTSYDLGRWIAKRIIELHGGIVVSRISSSDTGSIVTICLPLHYSWDHERILLQNYPSNPSELSGLGPDPIDDFEALFSFMNQRLDEEDSVSASSKVLHRSRKALMPPIPEDAGDVHPLRDDPRNISDLERGNNSENRTSIKNGTSLDAASDATIVDVHHPEKLSLLIVDDSVGTVRIMRKLMESKGHICSVAYNGAEAVEMYKAQSHTAAPFDVILLDICMPTMTGPECASAIRKLGYSGPIFGVTGHSLQDDVETFKAGGADEVIIKPLVYDTFYRAYVSWNGGKASRRPSADMRV